MSEIDLVEDAVCFAKIDDNENSATLTLLDPKGEQRTISNNCLKIKYFTLHSIIADIDMIHSANITYLKLLIIKFPLATTGFPKIFSKN